MSLSCSGTPALSDHSYNVIRPRLIGTPCPLRYVGNGHYRTMATYSILLVDDHPGVRAQLRALLANVPNTLVAGEAASADLAIDLATELHPQAVILDLHLPDKNGLEVLRALKQMPTPPLVIILSNMHLPEYRRACLLAGADFVLDKSFEFAQVRTIIDGRRHACSPS